MNYKRKVGDELETIFSEAKLKELKMKNMCKLLTISITDSYLLFVTVIISFIVFTSCNTSKAVSASYEDGQSVKNKCSCNSELDSSVICYSAVGESREEMFSKEKALSDARTGLASLVETRVLAVSNKFKESEKGESEQITEVREEAVRQVVTQVLSKMRVGCEDVIKTKDGTYKTYIRLEIKEANIEQYMDNKGALINVNL